ncbi:short-chain dehydrogenase/reductase [Rhodocollybia butyracea]|uniref:Short-chain dehydrogenase/reductase n=1 Tax=Rhodocollybia butyracea TaxID=206335 RepID=A0A9P5QAI3_9AGAR|nr:short-chain dehydrogenase/reductase [Rhodocollybia butyracea]
MSLPLLTATYHHDTYPAISPTNPSLSQSGKTILITGGGGGIGFEIARSFAKASASRIIIVGRRGSLLETSAEKLRKEFQTKTEFIAQQADIGDDSSITDLWEYLHSQNIFVHVLVLNAAHISATGPDTLTIDKGKLMEAFNVNVGGNFLMSAKFVKQILRPKGQQLNLVNVSTSSVHSNPAPDSNVYASSKGAFTALVGRIADERPAEDVQIISFHPGALYSEGASKNFDRTLLKWDEFALPADFSVWASSPEASWLHGCFVWAHWDVDEMKADREIQKKLAQKNGYMKVGVQGLTSVPLEAFMNK